MSNKKGLIYKINNPVYYKGKITKFTIYWSMIKICYLDYIKNKIKNILCLKKNLKKK